MDTNDLPLLRNHWWPRPGWHPGRVMLTWHLTFEHAKDLRHLVSAYQHELERLPGLNLVPLEWLHLTIQGVGYTDELSDEQLRTVTSAVRAEIAKLTAFNITFGRPVVFGEAIAIRPQPIDRLQQLWTAIRCGIANAMGATAIPTSPEQTHGFRPHISIAYSNTDTDAELYTKALDTIQPAPALATVTQVSLIRQERRLAPEWIYRWTTQDTAPLYEPDR